MKIKGVNVCPYDGLPCSSMVKGVGIGVCIKRSLAGKFRVCCRVSLMGKLRIFEDWVRGKLIPECMK